MKNCANCGKPFRTSRSGSTVNCPDCRRRESKSADKPKGKSVNCSCGKTNLIDGNGAVNSRSCPQCGDELRTEKMRDGTTVNIHVKGKRK